MINFLSVQAQGMCEHFQKMEELGFLFIWSKTVNVWNSQPLLVVFYKNCHVDDNATLAMVNAFFHWLLQEEELPKIFLIVYIEYKKFEITILFLLAPCMHRNRQCYCGRGRAVSLL